MKEAIRVAKRLVLDNKEAKKFQGELYNAAQLNWALPDAMKKYPWIRRNASTQPYDAIRGAVSALSNLDIGITVHPATVLGAVEGDDISQEARTKANEWEKCLGWALARAAKRKSGFGPDVIWSNMVYHEICARLIHLPTQFKAQKIGGIKSKSAFRFGDWAFRLEDARGVYSEYSDYGLERVLAVAVKRAQEIADEWPSSKAGKSLSRKIKKDPEHAKERYIEFDLVDLEKRCVWVSHGDDVEKAIDDKGIEVMGPEPWLKDSNGKPVPFLPWVCVSGGRPLLYPIIKTDKWVNANIMETMELSVTIAEAGSPRTKKGGPGADDIQGDYGTPAGEVTLTAYQTYENIQKFGLDPQMREMTQITENAIRQATVSDILVTGQPMGGVEAVSGYSLQLQTAIASLGPYRATGDDFYERLLETMLLATFYRGGEIEGYGADGKYTIDSEHIDPKHIYISVELKTDVPADRVQRITAANQMAQNLTYPARRILEFLGETDPEGAMMMWKIEQYEIADWMGRVQRRQMEQSGEIEQMAQEMAMGMMEQQMAEQEAMSAEQAGGMGNAPNLGAPQGMEGVEGEGFNPAMGGTAPIEAGAGATREGSTGMTRGGEEMA